MLHECYEGLIEGLKHDKENEEMLSLAVKVNVEMKNEYRIIPRVHPARAKWRELEVVAMNLGARTRVKIDFISESNRGLKATKDLVAGEDIMILPKSLIIKQ